MNSIDLQPTPAGLRRFTKTVAVSTLFLVFAGAMVTTTGSGLAVPDWPLSYGMVFPPMVGGIFYEHGHRMIAATVGLLTLIQAIWLQLREPKRFLRRLGWVALGAVILQGLLGGITVLLLLPKSVSVSHASLAEIFLCINTSIAFFASRSYVRIREGARSEATDRAGELASVAPPLVAAILVQMLIGAIMRHMGAGLAIPDFPLSFGRVVPPLTTAAVQAAFAHRAWGVIAGVLIVAFAVRALSTSLRPLAISLIAIVALQITLGGSIIWTHRQEIVTSLHVMTGALTLALMVLTTLTAYSYRRLERPSGLKLEEVEA